VGEKKGNLTRGIEDAHRVPPIPEIHSYRQSSGLVFGLHKA